MSLHDVSGNERIAAWSGFVPTAAESDVRGGFARSLAPGEVPCSGRPLLPRLAHRLMSEFSTRGKSETDDLDQRRAGAVLGCC